MIIKNLLLTTVFKCVFGTEKSASFNDVECRDVDEKLKCELEVKKAYDICILECGGKSGCVSTCNRVFNEQLMNCPCNANCPKGCPCPDYECQITTTLATTTTKSDKQAVLILNTENALNIPLLTDLDGHVEKVNFRYGERTGVESSCSVVFNGRAYVYGGSTGDSRRQISLVDSCELTRVGTLQFDMSYGACTSTGSAIFLCFDLAHTRTCRFGEDPTGLFLLLQDSMFTHQEIQIAASPCKSRFFLLDKLMLL